MAIAAPTASSTKETGIVERLRQTIIIKSFLNLNDDAKVVEFDKYLAKRILMIKKERKKLPNKLPPDEDLCRLIGYLENEHKVSVIDARSGSLEIQVKPPTLESLESLKNDYCSGHLNEMAENFILTAEVREKLDLKDESLKTTIKRGDYLECRKFFLQAADAESDLSSQTDHSKSQAEGNGLKEADQGVEANFVITTRDSEGKQFYNEQEHVTVTIRSGARKEEVQTTDLKDGNYTVHYKPKSAGRLHVMIEINGWPLTGSPWRVKVKPHQYKVVKSCGSFGSREGEFDTPRSIAKNEKTGEIAVGDMVDDRLQIFDENLKYLRSMGGKKASPTGAAVKIDCPASVAFLKNGDMIVIHGAISSRQMSLITDDGQFIQHFS
ncbi:E3 ubiquitin-protein ligase TRIM71-like [Stylophora pistillata]|uniref:E3 ubiquitin-protein ligase TRIM71-like n=1 Tax=Stylophora pistillata TaxID=50429 RepID=UPI000C04080A|nr:E3 ubiquitin-protein ligase TRIM71-like [Stylophora pistillata]